MSDYKSRLISIVRSEGWLISALKDVREFNLPDWYIAAGAIRNTVWDVLHGYDKRTPLNDIDVIYFDRLNIEKFKEEELERELRKLNSNINWEVKNHARKNPWAKSSCESIAYWSEIPTCVGVRLEQDDSITICAPHGLKDLMELVVRPIPEPYRDLTLYQKRISSKKWDNTWPKLRIEYN